MKTLLEYINESILNEGGNAVKTSNPIPAWVAPKVYEEIEAAIKKVAPDIKMAPLGSLGKKKDEDFTGDIDIAIEIMDRIRLAYEYCPSSIKIGVVTYNKQCIEFENNSIIRCFATGSSGCRG